MNVKLLCIITNLLIFPLSIHAESMNSNMWKQTHINKEFGFRLSYPDDWNVVPSKGPNVRISVSPNKGAGNCNVVAVPMSALNAYSQEQLNFEVDSLPLTSATIADLLELPESQLQVIENRHSKVYNVSAYYTEFEAQLDNLSGKYFWKKNMAFMMTPGMGWTITCGVTTKEASEGRQRYEKLRPYFKKITETFIFIDKH